MYDVLGKHFFNSMTHDCLNLGFPAQLTPLCIYIFSLHKRLTHFRTKTKQGDAAVYWCQS